MYLPSLTHLAVSTVVLALVLPAGQIHGQTRSSVRLSTDVVATLVTGPDSPEARERLAGHFTAMAEGYGAQTREHRAMADAYRKAPTASESKRPTAPDTAVHCDRLADRAAEAEVEARALAALYRVARADATSPISVTAGVAPDAGVAAHPSGAAEMRTLASTALTRADHSRLERHFVALAGQLEREAREHRRVAAAYRKAPTGSESKRPGAPDTALHCDRLAESSAKAAAEARALAKSHAVMGGGASKAAPRH